MSVILRNINNLLSQVQDLDPKVKRAFQELNSLSKTAALSDLVNDPRFTNIINLLTPFVVNYKVNQVLKLLKELEHESKWWK